MLCISEITSIINLIINNHEPSMLISPEKEPRYYCYTAYNQETTNYSPCPLLFVQHTKDLLSSDKTTGRQTNEP